METPCHVLTRKVFYLVAGAYDILASLTHWGNLHRERHCTVVSDSAYLTVMACGRLWWKLLKRKYWVPKRWNDPIALTVRGLALKE
jgi:hypothetical protein